jgi:hypothetical protein
MTSPFLIGDQEGFTPHIGRLVSMMNYARRTTLDMARGLTVEELDFLASPDGNSIGMLLEHFAAVEVAYQCTTFEARELNEAEVARWEAGLELGDSDEKNCVGVTSSIICKPYKRFATKPLTSFASVMMNGYTKSFLSGVKRVITIFAGFMFSRMKSTTEGKCALLLSHYQGLRIKASFTQDLTRVIWVEV